MIKSRPKVPIGRGRPRGEQGKLIRGLSVLPGDQGGVGGTPLKIISELFRSNQAKGAQNVDALCAPSQVSPHPGTEPNRSESGGRRPSLDIKSPRSFDPANAARGDSSL
jgi:hypothetical protein